MELEKNFEDLDSYLIKKPLVNFLNYVLLIDQTELEVKIKINEIDWSLIVKNPTKNATDGNLIFEFGILISERTDSNKLKEFYFDLIQRIYIDGLDRNMITSGFENLLIETLLKVNIGRKSALGKRIHKEYIIPILDALNIEIYELLMKKEEIKTEKKKGHDEQKVGEILNSIISTGIISYENRQLKRFSAQSGLTVSHFKFSFIIKFGNFEIERQMANIYLKMKNGKYSIMESVNSFILKEIEEKCKLKGIKISIENPALIIWKDFVKIVMNPTYFIELYQNYWLLKKYKGYKEIELISSYYGDVNLKNYSITDFSPQENIYFSDIPYYIDVIDGLGVEKALITIGRTDLKEFSPTDDLLFDGIFAILLKNAIFFKLSDSDLNKFKRDKDVKTIAIPNETKMMFLDYIENAIRNSYIPFDFSYLISELFVNDQIIKFNEVETIIEADLYKFRAILVFNWKGMKLPIDFRVNYSLGSEHFELEMQDFVKNESIAKNKLGFIQLKQYCLSGNLTNYYSQKIEAYIGRNYSFNASQNIITFDVKILNIRCRDHNIAPISISVDQEWDSLMEIVFKNFNLNFPFVNLKYKITKLSVNIALSTNSILSAKIIFEATNGDIVEILFHSLSDKLCFFSGDMIQTSRTDFDLIQIGGQNYVETNQFLITLLEDQRLIDLGIIFNQYFFDSANNYMVLTNSNQSHLITIGEDFGFGEVISIAQDSLLTKLKLILENNTISEIEVGKSIIIEQNSIITDTGEIVIAINRTIEKQIQFYTKVVLLFKEKNDFYQITIRKDIRFAESKKNVGLKLLNDDFKITNIKMIFGENTPLLSKITYDNNGVEGFIVLDEFGTYEILVEQNTIRAQLIGIFPDTDEISEMDLSDLWSSIIDANHKSKLNIN